MKLERERSSLGSPPILTMLLAGGAGQRMFPLTREHAKPMIPFGAIYRLIDIPLSNCINSGLRKINILTQDKALTLNRHVRHTWNILSAELNEFIEILPPTKRLRDTWYLGTADAIYQNIQSVEEEALPYVLILSADHVYKMNYRHMLQSHMEHDADVTVATTQVAPCDANRFGIVCTGTDGEISGFEEKPQHSAERSRFNPEACSASMGIYLFSTPVLLKALREDAEDAHSNHDFGRDILPKLIGAGNVFAYDFVDENRKEVRYWRDVGTLESYWEANMDLVSVNPVFNLYDDEWPIRAAALSYPPAKFVFAQEGRRMGVALDSLISHGCIISGGRTIRSVLSPGARIDSFSEVENSILLEKARVGRHCHIRRAIIDAGVHVPEYSEIGFDPESDRKAGHFVTDSGLVVVSRRPLQPVANDDVDSTMALIA
jgi:glucose-1-phosphate adenylyltransferase